MKRGEPFNVLRNRNSWSESPRAEAIAVSLFSGGLSVGSAAAATWLGTTAGMLAVTGVSVGLSLVTSWAVAALTPQPPSPKQNILVNGRDAAAPQDFIYGEVRKGGTITYYESTRGGSVLHQIITLAGHEVDSIVEVYANDEVLELSDDSYSYNGREGAGWVLNRNWIDKDDGPEMRVLFHTGSQTAITDPFANATTTSLNDTLFMAGDEGSANFGGTGQPTKESFVGTGMAYMYVRYSYNAGVFKNGLPLFSAKIRGRKVYDPRTDTTAWSDNAALCIRDYITGAYGLGDSQVDDTAFQVAANICDEAVALNAGGTEARYTINGVVRADQAYGDVLQEMTTACAGTLFWGTGKWKLHVGAYTAPVKDFTLDDIRSNISLQTRVNLRDQFNKVQGVFTDAGSDFIPVDYPPITSEVFKAQDNGIEQVLDLNLPFTTSSAAAQRLAKLTLFRGREQMSFTADFGLSAFEVEVGDIISLTMPRYGWEQKEFEVVGWVFGAGDSGALRISLTLRETSEAAFDWNAEESEIISNDSNLTSGVSAVTNLTATADGRISIDGTFINSILVAWDAAQGATGYEVEWMVNTSIDYDANGGVVEPADAVTAREQFIYKAYVEILYRQPDGDGFDFYNTGGGSSLTEEQVRAQLFESSERAALRFAGASVRNPTTVYSIVPVLDETSYLIRVRAFNDLGDQSVWTSVTFSTLKDTTAPNAPTSVAAIGYFQSAVVTWVAPTTNTDGSAFSDFSKYNVYASLSNTFATATLVGSSQVLSANIGGLDDNTTYYFWVTAEDYSGNESVPSLEASATTNFLSAAQLVDDIRQEIGAARIDVVSSLPSGAGYEAGDFVFLTTDKKLYQFDGTSWGLAVTAVEAVDISGELTTAQIAVNAITADLLAANAVTTTKIQDGAISTPKIVAGAVTAGTIATGAITAVKIAANAVTSDKIVADAITANKIATNAVTTDALAANSVTADQLTANSVTAGAISAGAVSADKIAVNTLAAISANLGDVTAGSINTVSSGIGLQVNIASRPNAVYTFQNSLTTYGIFSSNVAFGGGTMEIQSNGGFTGQFLNSSFSSGAFGPFAAINAQNTGSGGGHGQVGVSLAGGGYAFRSIDGGFYDVGGDGYNPFTGRHDGMIDKTETYELGDIVVDHATVHRALSDSFTELKPSTQPNQRGAVGVVAKKYSEWYIPAAFIDKEATQANQVDHVPTPENPAAALVTRLDIADYQDDYDLVNINAVGEGGVNVCGENGDIARGDLIVTSSTPGKGMRQDDDVVRSYTFARAREAVTFSSPSEVKMIACIYMCG